MLEFLGCPKPWRCAVTFHATTHRPLSSSFFWFIFRILYGNPQKELLRGLLGIVRVDHRRLPRFLCRSDLHRAMSMLPTLPLASASMPKPEYCTCLSMHGPVHPFPNHDNVHAANPSIGQRIHAKTMITSMLPSHPLASASMPKFPLRKPDFRCAYYLVHIIITETPC